MNADDVNIVKLWESADAKKHSKPHKDRHGHIWWKLSNGKLHREDGPAVEYADGGESWYRFDVPHRTDGYAIIDVADDVKSFYILGKRYDDVYEWAEAALQYEHPDDWHKFTDEEIEGKVQQALANDLLR